MSNIDISNQIYGHNISVELDELRNSLCPGQGHFNCPVNCPVWRDYATRGMSCNDALDKYPDDCISKLQIFADLKKGV